MRKTGPPPRQHSRHRNARAMPAGITQPAFDPPKQWIVQPASDRKAIAAMCKAGPARAAASGADVGTLHPFIITSWTESLLPLRLHRDEAPVFIRASAGLCPTWIVDLCSFAWLWILRSYPISGAGTSMRSAAPSIAGLQFRRRRQFAGCALDSENLGKRSTRQTPPRFSEGRQYRKPMKSCAKRRQHFLRSVSTGGHGRLGSSPSAWQPSGNRQAPVHRETRFPGAFPFAVPAANIVNGLQSCAKRACRPK